MVLILQLNVFTELKQVRSIPVLVKWKPRHPQSQVSVERKKLLRATLSPQMKYKGYVSDLACGKHYFGLDLRNEICVVPKNCSPN